MSVLASWLDPALATDRPLRGGEGYGRLRRVPDVRIKAVVTNRGKLTWRSRAGIPAVMGPEQLAGVMSILARQSAEAGGRPFDTRTVLGIALSACHSGEVKGTDSFGVFRM
jgi:hypothetical protein